MPLPAAKIIAEQGPAVVPATGCAPGVGMRVCRGGSRRWKRSVQRSCRRAGRSRRVPRGKAGRRGLEPRLTEPKSAVLPITPSTSRWTQSGASYPRAVSPDEPKTTSRRGPEIAPQPGRRGRIPAAAAHSAREVSRAGARPSNSRWGRAHDRASAAEWLPRGVRHDRLRFLTGRMIGNQLRGVNPAAMLRLADRHDNLRAEHQAYRRAYPRVLLRCRPARVWSGADLRPRLG